MKFEKPMCIYGLVRGYQNMKDYDDLRKRNKLLHKHFNRKFNYDVVLFHEGNITQEQQNILNGDIPNLKFVDISEVCFSVTKQIKKNRVEYEKVRERDQVNLGYMHMCRFYCYKMFKFLKHYEYIMRMDEDIFLKTEIKIDLYKFMKENKLHIGYGRRRVDGHKLTKNTFFNFVRDYVRDKNININCEMNEIDNRNFYNNFCILYTRFWFKPAVRKYLKHVDSSCGIYKYRWGDSPVQATALRLFSDSTKWYKFTEFEYTHGSHGWNNRNKKDGDEW